MAVALVGSFGTVTTSTTASVTPSFAQATTAGHLLVAWVCGDTSSITSSSSGWVKGAASANARAVVWYKPNSSAGETAPTFTSGTVFSNFYAVLAEFSGIATSSPVDQTAGDGVGQVTSSPNAVTAAGNDTATGELWASSSFWLLSKAGTGTTVDTYNNGATPTANLNNDSSSLTSHYRFAWGTPTGNSSAPQVSETQSSMNVTLGDIVLVTFKLAGGGTTYTKAGFGAEHA